MVRLESSDMDYKNIKRAVRIAPFSLLLPILLFYVASSLISEKRWILADVFEWLYASFFIIGVSYVAVLIYGYPIALLLSYFKRTKLYHILLGATIPGLTLTILSCIGVLDLVELGVIITACSLWISSFAWIIGVWIPNRKILIDKMNPE